MAAIEQHRRPAVRGGKLQTARRGPIGTLYLGDHAGERSVAQPILGHGQDLGIFASLSIDDPVGRQTHLLQTRCIKIETRERPKHRGVAKRRKPGGDTGQEQGRRSIVPQRGRAGGNFVQAVPVETSIDQSLVECGYPECQRRTARSVVSRQRLAQRRKVFGARLRAGGRQGLHSSTSTRSFPLCSILLTIWSRRVATGYSDRLVWSGLPAGADFAREHAITTICRHPDLTLLKTVEFVARPLGVKITHRVQA